MKVDLFSCTCQTSEEFYNLILKYFKCLETKLVTDRFHAGGWEVVFGHCLLTSMSI